MTKDAIAETISAQITNISFTLQENATQIGFWGGLVLLLGGSALAVYRACTKVPEIKMEKENALKELQNADPSDIEEALRAINRKAIKEYAKTFALPAIMVAGGAALDISCFVEVNLDLKDVSEKLAVTTAAFAAERARVANILGEEKEKELYYGVETREIENEDGTVTTVLVDKGGEMPVDPYTYEFSPDTSQFCEPNDDCFEMNMNTLLVNQAAFNDKLDKERAVRLSDILRTLYLEDSENFTAMRAGWLNPQYYDTPGKGYIDYRITPMRYIASDGVERWKFMLNFNCDGDIIAMGTQQRGIQGQKKEQWEAD